MSLPGVANPFVPGRGQMPPYLAGREREQRELIELVAYLKAGRGAPRDAVLSGPRGNGKTALLRWLCQQVEADGGIDTVWLTPSEVSSLDELATALAPPARFGSLRPDEFSIQVAVGKQKGCTHGGTRASSPASNLVLGRMRTRTSAHRQDSPHRLHQTSFNRQVRRCSRTLGWKLGGQRRALVPLLRARCRRRPLVAVLDESHTLSPELGQVLLNASQAVCAEAPFLLVMAGTPGLQRHLNTMSATFWSRAEKLGIGRLDEQAAAAALERPLAALTPAIACSTEALAKAVAASQGYPYFVQLWGAALWQVARDGGTTEVDGSVAAAAAPIVSRSQSAYYQDRYQELEREQMIDVAAELARAFADQATKERASLNKAIASALPDGQDSAADVLRCRDRLADLGYVWNPPDADDAWQPGVPSLMDYVRRRAG